MQTFLRISTTLVIIAHAMLGCCWHHAHAHPPHSSGQAVVETVCCHGHKHADHARGERNLPLVPDHEPCQETDCVYVWENGASQSLADSNVDSSLTGHSPSPTVAETGLLDLLATRRDTVHDFPGIIVSAQKLRAQSQNYRL